MKMAEYHKPLNIKTNLKLRCKYVASQFFIFYVDKLIFICYFETVIGVLSQLHTRGDFDDNN